MYEDYEKEFKLVEKSEKELNLELVKSIIRTKQDLENANRNFEFAEGELVDYFLYQIKANQAKLNYLLKKAKNNKIVSDRVNEIEIKKQVI